MVTGIVQKLGVKHETSSGKRLRTPLYSMLVQEQWYGCGFDNPNVAEGDCITFEATKGKFGMDADVKSIKQATKGEAAPARAKEDNRQQSIVYQHMHTDAIAAVSFAIDHGFVKLPAKASDQYDVYISLIDDLTVQWTKDGLNPQLEERAVPAEEDEQDAFN